jgi:hypothetical protein
MRAGEVGLIAIASLMMVMSSGCGASVTAASDGRWSACSAAGTPTAVTVHRSIHFARPGFEPIVLHSTPRLASRLFDDFCVTEAHQEKLSGASNCPDDFGLLYSGAFLAADRTVATFSWHASGCQELSLVVGSHHATTELVAVAATAAPHLDSDFRRVLGAGSVSAIFESPVNPA